MNVFLLGSVALLTLLANAKSEEPEPTPIPVKAKVHVSMGEARLFTGEGFDLACSVPDQPAERWTYHWFLDGVRLTVTSVRQTKAVVLNGGKYTCRGEKQIDTWPYSQVTLLSEPFSVHVDGGWALLKVPQEPLLIEETMTLTCRIRDDPLLVEVIFYKDGVEIQKQKDKDLVFPSLMLKDQGSYWCRATWIQNRYEQHSAQSLPAFVTVLDKLETPLLTLDQDLPEGQKTSLPEGQKATLSCITQLNVREGGQSIEYLFLKDGDRLGRESSHNKYAIQSAGEDDAGAYTCRVRVRSLKLERWSKPLDLNVQL